MGVLAELSDRAQELTRDKHHVVIQYEIDGRVLKRNLCLTVLTCLEFKLAFKQNAVAELEVKDWGKFYRCKSILLIVRAGDKVDIAVAGEVKLGHRIEIVAVDLLLQCVQP